MTPRDAAQTVLDLFQKYDITDPNQAKRLVRERFSQEDLDAYNTARETLYESGVIG